MVACEHNKSSQGQEDFAPDDPLKEAIVGLWYDASVHKPNIKVVFVQMTLIFFTDRLWHPYGIPQPFLDPAADVVGCVDIHCKAQGLCVPAGAMVVAIHPALLGGVIHRRSVASTPKVGNIWIQHLLHKPNIPLLKFPTTFATFIF